MKKTREAVRQEISWTYDPGRAMQARLLERPQQVNSMNSRASRADPPKKPATTNPSTYPPVEIACNREKGESELERRRRTHAVVHLQRK